jgi:magnesium transporter
VAEGGPTANVRRPRGSAGQEAVAEVPRAAPSARVEEVRASLAGRAFATATEVAVVDDERLVGLVPIERLLAAPDLALLGELADISEVAAPEEGLESSIRKTVQRRGRSIAVVDREGRFQGLVPPDRLLQVIELEHEEDLARLGGFLSGASEARMASEEPVLRRLWHRLPWLALGLLGAMASALVVGAFEEELRKQVLLAFFIPAVVYMADAVGTQTERSSSAGWHWASGFGRFWRGSW